MRSDQVTQLATAAEVSVQTAQPQRSTVSTLVSACVSLLGAPNLSYSDPSLGLTTSSLEQRDAEMTTTLVLVQQTQDCSHPSLTKIVPSAFARLS